MTALGRRIRQLRKERCLTQEQVARRGGMSYNGFVSVERGVRKDPHYSTLCAIARGLDVALIVLLADESTGDAATPLRERGQ